MSGRPAPSTTSTGTAGHGDGHAPRASRASKPLASVALDGFRPDVQGLRALAVTLVVVYHLYPWALHGGYVGVDAFFVISGYLITGLIARGIRRTGKVGLVSFYSRRARRLLPAATVVLTVTWLVSRVALPVTQLPDAADQIRASALYVQNWVLAHNSVDYLKSDDAASPVQHFWSLSVEEQFYLIWPLIFLGGAFVVARLARRGSLRRARRAGRTTTFTLAVALVVVSLCYSVHETALNPAAAYFETTTRIWELGIGGVLALLPRPVAAALARVGVLAWIGLALLLTSAVCIGAHTAFPGDIALVPVLGTVLLLACGSSAARLGTSVILARRPLVFLGDLSYGIYLWHWPMIVLWRGYFGPLRPLDGPGIAVAAVLAAWLTKRLIEDPIRLGRFFTASTWRSLALVTCAIVPVLLASTYLIAQPRSSPSRLDAAHAGVAAVLPAPSAAATSSAAAARPPTTPASRHVSRLATAPTTMTWLPASAAHTSLAPTSSKIIPSLERVSGDLAVASGSCKSGLSSESVTPCTFGDTTDPRLTVALVGDSHAAQWSTALDEIATSQHWKLIAITHDSCTFGAATLVLHGQSTPFTACSVWDKRVLSDLINRIHPDVVIVSSRATAGVVGHRQADATSFATIARGEVAYWDALRQHHINVVAIHETPEPGMNVPDCLARHDATVDGCGVPTSKAITRDTPIDQASKIVGSAVPVINMDGYLCTATRCPAVVGNVIVYRDNQHLSATYTRSVEPFLMAALLATPALKPT